MMFKFFQKKCLMFLAGACCLIATPALSQDVPPYNWQYPYQQAVPTYIDALIEATKDLPNRDEIRQWAQDTSKRLPEFLNDMIAVCAVIEQQEIDWTATDGNAVWEYQIAPVKAFDEKWLAVFQTCPDCEDIFPLIKPVVDGLFAEFPPLPPQQPNELPQQYLYRVYQFLEDVNPWGLGEVFVMFPQKDRNLSLSIAEISRDRTIAGIRQSEIVYRKVYQKENHDLKFFEWVENDKVKLVTYKKDPKTLIHETLNGLEQIGAQPKLIKALQELTSYIDAQLRAQWQQGQLDDFSYSYLFDQTPITNEMVHVKHPFFLLPPYYNEYKVMEYYPRDNMDQIYADWGWEEYQPESAKATLLSRIVAAFAAAKTRSSATARVAAPARVQGIIPKTSVAPIPDVEAPKLDDAMPPVAADMYIPAINRITSFWSSGLFIPLYLFLLVGANKIIGL